MLEVKKRPSLSHSRGKKKENEKEATDFKNSMAEWNQDRVEQEVRTNMKGHARKPVRGSYKCSSVEQVRQEMDAPTFPKVALLDKATCGGNAREAHRRRRVMVACVLVSLLLAGPALAAQAVNVKFVLLSKNVDAAFRTAGLFLFFQKPLTFIDPTSLPRHRHITRRKIHHLGT